MQPILVVTPFFAPQSHAAVFRAYKLAKYLPRYGFRPFVVTVDTNYDYHEDPGLLAALPAEVTTIGARYVEPTLRGVEYFLGLGDRRFSKVVKPSQGPAPKAAPARPGKVAHNLISRGLLRIPDRHWPWLIPALSACRRIVREHGARLVLTSSDPFTSYLVGLALKREGLTWVADLRDPATHSSGMHSEYPWVYAIQREIERRAMMTADAVTVAAKSIGLILSESHGLDLSGKLHFIPTGLDTALLNTNVPLPELPPGRRILFSGEYLPYYGERFFRWFAAARRDPRVRALGYHVLIVGKLDVNRPNLEATISNLGLADAVQFVPHQPQEVLYALVRGSDFGLLPYGDRLWWCLAAKLVDYIALGTPVLAVVSDPSEARSRLGEAGLGVFLDGDDQVATRRLTEALIAGPSALTADPRVSARYTVEHQVSSFAAVFEKLLAQPSLDSRR